MKISHGCVGAPHFALNAPVTVIPVLNGQPTLLALDHFGGHKTDNVLDAMKAHFVTISVIPVGCTGIVHPLVISINRPFKDILKVLMTFCYKLTNIRLIFELITGKD
jgi:hypothetical protein